MYLLWACLSFCFTKCFAWRKANLSVGRLSLLYLSYKLSLFLMVRLISWVIHGSDGFVLIVCCGTCFSIPKCRYPLNSSQSKLIDLPSREAKKTYGKDAYGSQVPPVSFLVHKYQSWFLLAYLWFLYRPRTAQHCGLLFLIWWLQISLRLDCL